MVVAFLGAAVAAAGTGLAGSIDALLARPELKRATVGVEVRRLRDGAVLYARDPERYVAPASAHKLVVTAAILDALGPEARIRTTAEAMAPLDAQGRLTGDLYLVGRGDPNLHGRVSGGRASGVLEEMADALRAAGLRRVEGRVVGHEGLFTGDRRGSDWGWEDLVWWYGAEVSALSFNDNCADLRVTPGARVGDPVGLVVSPQTAYFSVTSTATTSAPAPKSDLVLARDLSSNAIRLGGTLGLGLPAEELNVALVDPARYAATVFAEVLASRGIAVTGGVLASSEPLPAGVRPLASHQSPPLSEMLRTMNKPSRNLHAEMLLRVLGSSAKGEGSAEAGVAAATEALQRLGVDPEDFVLHDASGLSRLDLATAHGLVALLVAMDRHPHARAFRDSLPVAGVDGSLRGRLKATPAEGRLSAKTGWRRQTSSLVGYATTKSGEGLAFAVLLGNHRLPPREATALLDRIALALLD
jgi:D-alanyl-D-alanine carboxypeptidase/D-alanyl-D-alanine-endopeptidase (penicillin-binding protein 4)